jgi:hypothetical protein
MTAEIALMNRSAIALAADSAVTVSTYASEKVYNSAEKIFELSKASPIAVMLYNLMTFMGYPLEVLIRQFRAEHDQVFESVEVASSAFLGYISGLPIDAQAEEIELRHALSDPFRALFGVIQAEIVQAFNENKTADEPRNLKLIFQNLVESEISEFDRDYIDGYLTDVSQHHFDHRYRTVVEEVANEANVLGLPLQDDELGLLCKLAFSIVKAGRLSSRSTGLVFAGFADKMLFPSLLKVEIDGVYFGKLKHWFSETNQIDNVNNRAFILPFAQREMFDRFIYGIDDDFEQYLVENSGKISNLVAAEFQKHLTENENEKNIPPVMIEDIAQFIQQTFREHIFGLKQLSLRDTFETVANMPKAELAQMAESLISVTSMKRKMSLESETVGGPIDVALLTKGEGFIWIKRKHYFDPAQNPGFFSRHYPINSKPEEKG